MDTSFTNCKIISELKNKHIELWENTPENIPEGLEQFDFQQQRIKEKQMSNLTDEIIFLVKGFSNNTDESGALWGTALKKLIYSCGTDIIGLNDISMRLLIEGGFCEATSEFITRAREFDTGFKTDDIFQSLRNVWIMNCIQKLMGIMVMITPSIQAYSMLYPYTDNYLDATSVSLMQKKRINKIFEKRLTGEELKAETEYENKLFKLVSMIEEQFNRDSYPMVYMGLLGIHAAQNKSLLQHNANLSEGQLSILDISLEKGGTSVLADAFLVNGKLSPEEAAFMFSFGIILQLLDDLQDALTDRKCGNTTIFSQKGDANSKARYTNKLINFTIKVLDEDTCFLSREATIMKSTIKKSVIFLIIGAVACNHRMYGSCYLSKIEKYSPLSFNYLRGFYKRVSKEYGKLKINLKLKPFGENMAKAFAAGVI